jgi:hypothetical protein
LPRAPPAEQQQRHQSSARAHDGAVTGLLAAAGGLHYLSAGTDSRVRLWDAWHHHNALVNYAETHNRAIRGRQLACSEDGSLLFHPSGSIIQVRGRSGRLAAWLLQLAGQRRCSAHHPAGALPRVWAPAGQRAPGSPQLYCSRPPTRLPAAGL